MRTRVSSMFKSRAGVGRGAIGWLALAAGAAPASAQEARWTNGTGDGLWHTAGNWSIQRVPDSGDAVVIGPNMAPVVAQAAINSVLSVNAQSPLAIGHGVSSLAEPSTFTDLTVVNNIFSAGGMVTISGVSHMAGVTFAGPGPWKSGGTMRVNPGLVVLSGTVFINEGTVNVEGSLTLSSVGSLMDNRGTLTLIGGPDILSNGVLINSGTLRKTGAGISATQCRIQGDGPIDVREGSVYLQGPVALGPQPVTVAQGAFLVFQQPAGAPFSHALSGPTFSGGGIVAVGAGGTIQAPTMRVEDDTAFNLTGEGALSFENGMLRVGSLGVVRNSGNLRWGTLRLHGPGELVNEAPGKAEFPSGTSPVIGPDATVINRAYTLVATNITIDAATLMNDVDGLLELNPVQINSPAPAQATLVNNGGLVFPPEGTQGPEPKAEVRCRFEQGQGGFTWARSDNSAARLSLLAGGEFGAGGSEIQLGRSGENPSVVVSLGGGTFRITSAGHVVRGAQDSVQFVVENAGTVVEVTAAGELELRVGDSNSGTFDAVHLRAPAQLGGAGPCRNFGHFVWTGQVGVGGVADFRNEPGAVAALLSGGPILRGTFTNAAGATVEQAASLDMAGGNVQNHGLWRISSLSTPTISGANAEFKNHNQLHSRVRGATINVTLDNPGHVIAEDGPLRISGPVRQIVGDALTGGTWEAKNRGTILFTQALLRRFDGATVIGGTEGIPAAAGVREVTRGGEVRANDNFLTDGPLTVNENGKVGIDPGGSVTIPGGVTNGTESGPPDPSRIQQRAQGEGPAPLLTTPLLVNHANLFPGGEGAVGPFNLVGDLNLRDRGTVHADLGGTIPEAEFDQVAIDGDATLGGTLRVRLIGTFIPQVGQTFEIMNATGTLTGGFSTLDLPRLPGGAQLAVVYGPQGVSLRVDSACYPDCDPGTGPGALDIFDFLCFQNAFASAEPYACDCDLTSGARVCDIFDFLCFQNAFAAGCP